MRRFALLGSCLLFSMSISWANVVGTTDAALFSDTVDWCQFGCTDAALPTPDSWVSVDGETGYVGLVTGQDFYNQQQGSTWFGDFNPGQGLIYNGAQLGNTPGDIAATFNQAETGAGAYIQSTSLGSFTATITLYDINFNPIGSFTTSGTASHSPGTALFIGATSTTPVWAVQFDAIGTGPFEPDFAIGTMGLSPSVVPEPSFLLVIPAIGLVGLIRRRRANTPLRAS
jgi:hypothetical protein